MARRPSTADLEPGQFADLLPHYLARRSSDFPEWLIVTCPREECGLDFLVHRKQWYNSSPKLGRSCPYCFMANRIPKPKDIKRST